MNEQNPPPLEYAGHSPLSRPLATASHVRIGISCFATWAVLMVLFCFVVPRFEVVLKDFKTELPGVTKVLLQGSRWVANGFGWAILAGLFAGIFGLGLLIDSQAQSDQSIRIYRRVAAMLQWLLLIGVLAFAILGLFLPVMSLVNSVTGR